MYIPRSLSLHTIHPAPPAPFAFVQATLLSEPDMRSVREVLDKQGQPGDTKAIRIFALPPGWFAQECSFVPRQGGSSEDDGWLLTYVFDESQLLEDGSAPADARSELWIVDALNMEEIVAKIRLPQRGA